MPRTVVASDRYQVPVRGFTQAVEAPAGGRLLFVSGITARRADGAIVGEGDIRAQARQVYESLRLILAEAGGTLDDVVRTTTYLRRMEDHAAMHEVKLEVFGERLPASTTVQIVRLFDERQLIEVEATAVLPLRVQERAEWMRRRTSEE